jgi:adenosine deaminase
MHASSGALEPADPRVYDSASGVGPKKLDFETVYRGLVDGIEAGATLSPPVHAKLVLCFLRDRSCAEALAVLKLAAPFISEGHIIAVGMDNREGAIVGADGTEIAAANRPAKFRAAYEEAGRLGIAHRCCHAGEEGDASFIVEALDVLGVERIDHGEEFHPTENLVMTTARTVCRKSLSGP